MDAIERYEAALKRLAEKKVRQEVFSTEVLEQIGSRLKVRVVDVDGVDHEVAITEFEIAKEMKAA